MRTFFAKKQDIERRWYLVDADGKILGRLVTNLANILRGKNKSIYTPHVDTGDFVVVVNAGKIKLTGKKWNNKLYHHHSGYPGGLKTYSAEQVLQTKPEDLIRHAVRGMLPKSRLGRQMIKKLKIYSGPDHPHEAQNPVSLNF